MKFITTEELGRLCKWLRILGFDTSSFRGEEKRDLIIKSLRETRIILTRDSKMGVYSGVRMLHVKSDFIEEQVKQVMRELDIKLDKKKFFTICVVCNAPLKRVEKIEIEKKVPPYVYETQDEFMACGICDKVYWRGTHWAKVDEFVKNLRL